jgi:hypothetical protein
MRLDAVAFGELSISAKRKGPVGGRAEFTSSLAGNSAAHRARLRQSLDVLGRQFSAGWKPSSSMVPMRPKRPEMFFDLGTCFGHDGTLKEGEIETGDHERGDID